MNAIDIRRPFEAFRQHISLEDNKRILFSAPFGSGKTYFLKQYFEIEAERVNAFWLSPVKYVVSPNEDIFEYIKFDLAYQLLECDRIKEELKVKIDTSQYVYQYIVNNPKDIFKLLFSALENAPVELAGIPTPMAGGISKVGKLGNTLLDAFNRYQDHKKKLDEKLKTTANSLVDYLKDSTDIKGSIFEDDLISQMIRAGLDQVKEDKQNILVVDDLDRLDPEHIFRILNILSVHQDYSNGQNKFGFDKIIVVCDLENIRKIYIHKYGENVDFDGYIEKFYSTSEFKFTNQQAVDFYCQSNLTAELSENAKAVLGQYLSFFVKNDLVSVRSVIKHRIKPIVANRLFISASPLINNKNEASFRRGYTNADHFRMYGSTAGYQSNTFYIESADFEFLTIVKSLVVIFGSLKNLEQAIKLADKNSNYPVSPHLILPALRVMAPMQLLVEKYDEPLFLAVSIHTNQTYPHEERNVVRDPFLTLFGLNVSLNLNWSKEYPYTSQESFYSNANKFVDSDAINKLIINSENGLSGSFKEKHWLSMLEGVIQFLKNRDYIDILA